MEELWLGVDIGTTMIKAAAYRPDGTQAAYAEASVPVQRTGEGWAEQDMHAVWSGVCAVLRAVAKDVDTAVISSIGLAAQGDGLWMLDDAGQPNGPAMLWNDTRAGRDVEALIADGRAAAVGRACNTSNWPGTSGSLYGWLKRNDPARAAKTARVLYCADWVGYCMTGVVATDLADASIPFFDLQTKSWSDAALAALDCEDLKAKLPNPQPADTILGRVTKDAAEATGLPEGLPVSTGTLDLGAMIVGMGMDQSGQTMMILGTTAVVNILTDRIEPADAPVGATTFHSTADLKIRILAPSTGAAAFDWFTALHPQSLGGDSPGEVAEKLNALARDVPPGSRGVLFLPYLNGERAPFVAPLARGSFHGLTSDTSKAEMGRAVMEGAAFSLRHCFEAEGATPSEPVQLTGGGARNALWCDIVADVLGVPVIVSPLSDHGLWGAACIGAAAAGKGNACRLAARDEHGWTHEPDAERHAVYNGAFKRYAAVSEASRPIWAAMRDEDE